MVQKMETHSEDLSLLRKCPLKLMLGIVNKDDAGCSGRRCMWYVTWANSGDCAIPRLVEVLHPELREDYLAKSEKIRKEA